MSLRDLDERDLLVTEPESLTVGQLNRAVRLLRERLHLALTADAAPTDPRLLPSDVGVCSACRTVVPVHNWPDHAARCPPAAAHGGERAAQLEEAARALAEASDVIATRPLPVTEHEAWSHLGRARDRVLRALPAAATSPGAEGPVNVKCLVCEKVLATRFVYDAEGFGWAVCGTCVVEGCAPGRSGGKP